MGHKGVSRLLDLGRGELFVLGRTYLAGEWQIEIHPLLRSLLTSINNLADPSSRIQPRIVWDMTTNVQLISGIRWRYGGNNSEFGRYHLRFFDDDVFLSPNNSAFLQLTRYFQKIFFLKLVGIFDIEKKWIDVGWLPGTHHLSKETL